MALCLKIMTPSEKSLSLSAAMENLLDHDDDFVNDDDASPSVVSSSRNKPAAPAGSTPGASGKECDHCGEKDKPDEDADAPEAKRQRGSRAKNKAKPAAAKAKAETPPKRTSEDAYAPEAKRQNGSRTKN